MTQEEEQLLIKDMRARSPYGVKGKTLGSKTCTLLYIGEDGSVTADIYHCWIGSKQFVPYLRPMSSMTEEEQRTLDSMCNGVEMVSRLSGLKMFDKAFDWLNANHFNYRLPPHLFIEVTEENNPYK